MSLWRDNQRGRKHQEDPVHAMEEQENNDDYRDNTAEHVAEHVVDVAGFAPTPEQSDYETLSPIPLSPYVHAGESTGAATPSTPQSVAPISPYNNVAFDDLLQAGKILDAANITQLDKTSQEKPKKLSSNLENISTLAHLATFGMLGVLIRYGLGELFDGHGHVTSGESALFHDLPANMFGSFFMGWVGCGLKKDIAHFSQLLALGLSTGLMGSITTFSSWSIKLVAIMTKGYWLRGIIGFLVGLELACMSLLVGMRSSQLLRWLIVYYLNPKVAPDNVPRKRKSFLIFLAASILLWASALVLAVKDKENFQRRRLWLACVLGPPGVWLRWLLARQNGKGLTDANVLSWLPWGTLAANLLACIAGFVLSIADLAAHNNYHASLWAGAIQLGSLGCLSTVSTFVVEIYNLDKARKRWRAYVYILVSLGSAIFLGIVFYSSVVWAKGYHVLV